MTILVNQLIGFGGYNAAGATQTLVDPTLNANKTALNTDNVRTVIAAAAYGVSGSFTEIRVTFVPPSSGDGCNLNPIYIGQKGASAPNFDGGQVQLLNGGAALFAMTAGGSSITSDWATFSFNTANDLVIAQYVTGTTTDDCRYIATLTNYQAYHDNGAVGSSTAANTTPASQSSWASHACFSIDLIEVR